MTSNITENTGKDKDSIVVGSTWIALYRAKKWPVVICDDATPPSAFIESRTGTNDLPAILLGRRKYIWVDRRFLEEWEHNHDYLTGLSSFAENDVQDGDNLEVVMEKQRRTAFCLDAQFMQDHKFWQNCILNASEARKEDLLRRKKRSYSDRSHRSRRHSHSTSSVPQRTGSVVSGGRRYVPPVDTYGGLWQPATRSRVTKRPRNGDNDCFIVGVETGTFAPRSAPAANISKRRRPSTPELEESPMAMKAFRRNADKDEADTTTPVSSHNRASLVSSEVVDSSHQVKLIFSEEDPTTNLLIPKASLASCKFLSIRCNYSNQHGCDIIPLKNDIAATKNNLTSKEMKNIIPYFWTKEIGPVWRNKKSQHPFGRLGSTLKDEYAGLLGLAFVTASKISHEELQEYALEKLKALYPLPDLSLLSVILMCSSLPLPKNAAELELGAWVVKHVAESYFKLMQTYPDMLQRQLKDNSALRDAVMKELEKMKRDENSGSEVEAIASGR